MNQLQAINSELLAKLKKLLLETGTAMIPLTVIFESLGFPGLTGLGWGVVSGAVAATAIQLGWELQQIAGRWFLIKKADKNEE
jgi:hypothetical protein